MPSFKGVLLDLGGVVYIGETPLPGAIAAISRLREAGIAVRFLTNTTRSPRRRILEKLRGMGLDVQKDELFTPSSAARELIEKQALSPHLLIHPALAEDFEGLPQGEHRAVVIGDAGDSFTYAALDAAFRELVHGARFIALANNRSFRAPDGELSLDAGAFVAALAFASQREPLVLGKPSRDFFHAALDSMDCAPGEAVMIGDDVENDVGGAVDAGLGGILVRTGKYARGDERSIALRRSRVADDLAVAVEMVLRT